MELRDDGLLGQLLLSGFGDAEVDDLGHRDSVVDGDEDVRGFEVAVNDPLLVRVLHGLTNLQEKLEAFVGRELGLVAILSDRNATDQLHDEVRTALVDL